MNIISDNIKILRLRNKWSQAEVAKRLKISIPAFSKIETGRTDINISRLAQIAKLFDISTAEIITKDRNLPVANSNDEINTLKEKLSLRDEEIIKLQKKVIDLYEEIRNNQK